MRMSYTVCVLSSFKYFVPCPGILHRTLLCYSPVISPLGIIHQPLDMISNSFMVVPFHCKAADGLLLIQSTMFICIVDKHDGMSRCSWKCKMFTELSGRSLCSQSIQPKASSFSACSKCQQTMLGKASQFCV